MNYELFQASAVKEFDRCHRERAELRAENAALKAELDDWNRIHRLRERRVRVQRAQLHRHL